MTVSDATSTALVERVVDFNHGYRMKCECGGISYISPEDYHAEANHAHMTCQQCGGSFNYGRGVAAIRDVNDAALDNDRLSGLAWYHTSAEAEWPAAAYHAGRQAELDATAPHMSMPKERLARWMEKELNKALHVGTYEAAIENMVRRIRNQRGDPAAFHLHRVGLRIDPARVNEGFRDENEEPASQLTTMDLDADGLDAVRYLNTYEAVGSLSLAVVPEAIAWVQTLKLPAASLAPAHPESLVELLGDAQARLETLRSAMPDTSAIPPRQLRLMQLRGEPGPDGIVAASRDYSHEAHEIRANAAQALHEEYVRCSPRIAEDFGRAMKWPDDMSTRDYADFFAASAIALTDPGAVIALVASQPTRAVTLPPRKKRRADGSLDW